MNLFFINHHHFIYNPSQKNWAESPEKDSENQEKNKKKRQQKKKRTLITTNKGQTEMTKDGKTSSIW